MSSGATRRSQPVPVQQPVQPPKARIQRVRVRARPRASLLDRATDIFVAWLARPPEIGRSLLLYVEPGRSIATSRIERVLGEVGSDRLCVETRNTYYELELLPE